jgi:hypothetical protein
MSISLVKPMGKLIQCCIARQQLASGACASRGKYLIETTLGENPKRNSWNAERVGYSVVSFG